MPSTEHPRSPSLPGDLAAQQEIAEFLARSGIRPIEERGRVLGPAPGYQLRERIGQGGMGTVYRARDLALERDVAVKLIKRSHRNRRVLAERLEREAKLLASLEHDNVITIHAVGESDAGEPFVVMPLIRGSTLGEWVAEREPSVAERLELALRAGRGLLAVHEAGLIHRDFKPANVLVQDQPGARPRVFVSDFGLARTLELDSELEPTTLPSDSSPSQAGARTETASRESGTTRYMAPELFRGQAATRASDQYAYCVSVWELLLGPGSVPEYGWVRPPERPDALPASIYAPLARGLSPEPSERWPDLASLLAALTPRQAAPVSRWRGVALGLTLALGLGGAGVGLEALRAEGAVDPVCTDAGELQTLWSAAQRAKLAAQLERVASKPGDRELITSTLASLDTAAQAWAAREREQCQREWLLGGLHDSCGQLWQARFRRQVELLGDIGPKQLDHVPELLRSLARPGCSQLMPPLDFEVAERIDRSRDAVALGEFELAEKLADQARHIGEGIGSCGSGWGHERAAAHFQLGLVHAKAGRPQAALAELGQAQTHATACVDAALVRRIHLRAAKIHALQLGDAEAASTALELARANANVVGDELAEDAFEARVVEAAIAILDEDYARARDLYFGALEVIERVDPLRAAEAQLNLGTMVMLSGGKAELAEVHWERGMSELEARLGAERARNKRALQAANLARVYLERGQVERAAHYFKQAAASPRAPTRLVGINGLLQIELDRVYASEDYAGGLELAESFAAQLAGTEDLPPQRLATHLFLRGRLRLAASYDEAFMAGDPSRRDAVLDAGFADLERSLELWTAVPDQEARYDCMLFLAWHLHDDSRTPADQGVRDRHAQALLDAVLRVYGPDSFYLPTAHSLEAALQKNERP